MKVTAIIPTLAKNKDYCELAVKSLRATTDWDIIVVSNGTDINYPMDIPAAKRLRTRDQGQCNAVNIGAQAANPTTQYLFVVNDDMYFAPGWNRKLRFDYPVFSPNLVEPTDNEGSAPPFLKYDGGYTLDKFCRECVDKFIDRTTDAPGEAATTGFNLPFFIDYDVWRTIGGYDVKYDPWGSNSDTDLQTLIELAGIQPMRLRDVLVYHFSNKSGTFDGTHQDAWQANWDYYTQKWGFNRDDEPIPDTWMALNMVNREKNIYNPEWKDKYGR